MDHITCDQAKKIKGDFSGAWNFFPIDAGVAWLGKNTVVFEGYCFKEIRVSIEIANTKKMGIDMTIDARQKKSLLCAEQVFTANAGYQQVTPIFFEGKNTAHLEMTSEAMAVDFLTHGMAVQTFCEDIIDEAISIFSTFLCFGGGGLGTRGHIQYFQPKVP